MLADIRGGRRGSASGGRARVAVDAALAPARGPEAARGHLRLGLLSRSARVRPPHALDCAAPRAFPLGLGFVSRR